MFLSVGLLAACNGVDNHSQLSNVSNDSSVESGSKDSTSLNDNTPQSSQDDVDVVKRLVISRYPKRSYFVGEKLSLIGLEVKLYTIQDGVDDGGVVYNSSNIISDPIEGTTFTEKGNKKITLKSKVDDSIIETSFTVVVDVATVEEDIETRKLVVQSLPKKIDYYQNERFEVSGLKIAQEIYINGNFQSSEPVLEEDYKLFAGNKELHDGDVLDTPSSRFVINVESTKSTDDLVITGTSFVITIEVSEEYDPSLPSAIELFTKLKSSRNYTIEVTDAYRKMSLTKTYTENAYFFDSEKDYFGHFGYGISNNQVFRFTLDGDTVVPDIPFRLDETSDVVLDELYGSGVMTSFADMVLDHLPDTTVTGNTYRLDLESNEQNVNNLIDIINYGDGVMDFSDVNQVLISVTGENSLRIKLIATLGLSNGNYTYVIDVKNVNTTKNDVIENYIASGKGAKVLAAIPEKFKTILNKIKSTKNYTFDATYYGSENVLKEKFVDRFIEDACYTDDKKSPSSSIGYAAYQDTIFSYAIDNNEVLPGEVQIDTFGNPYKSLYESVYSFIELDLFSMDTKSEGEKLFVQDQKNLNILLQCVARVSYRNYYSMVQNAYFEYVDENSMKVVVDFGTFGKAEGTISAIETTEIPEIEAYLASGKGPHVDTSKENLEKVYNAFMNAKSYKEDMGLTDNGAHIGYTYYMEHAVFVDYELPGYEDYGYIDYQGSIYEFSVSNSSGEEKLVLGEKIKDNTSLKDTSVYPTTLSIFNDIEVLEYSVLNNYFMTTDVGITGAVCDFMGMSDDKDTYIPYGAGLKADYNEEDISQSTLYLGYFVTTSDGGYYRIENAYSAFDAVSFDFIEEFLK